MMLDLPLYKAVIDMNDQETGIECISFVEFPATESNFQYFADNKQLIKYSVQNEEQRKVLGLVMSVDQPIYRRTDDGFEYYLVFDKKTVAQMAEKMFKQNNQGNFDTEHNFEFESGITMTQCFLKDSEKGIVPTGFEEYADGSLFAELHVENDEVWQAVKDGTYAGFSLAGNFNIVRVNDEFNNQSNNISKKMSKLNRIKEMLKSMLEVFGDVSTDRGTLIYDGDEEIKVGDAVKLLDGENNEVDAEDGDYQTDDKRIIVVKDGKVEEIKDVEEEPETEETPENPEEDVNASAQEPEESATKQKFNAVKLAFELTYEEKYNKIYEAIKALGLEYFYIVQAADDFAVVASYEEDTEKLYKFDLTWNEDEVTASNQTEVKVEYVPVAEEPEPSNEEEPSTEPETEDKPEEEQMAANNEPAALSAQEAFAKLEEQSTKKNSKVSAKMEAMAKRGYKFNL